MQPADLKTYFHNQAGIARAYQISEAAVSLWFKKGRIPPLRQYQLPEAVARTVASSAPRQTGGPAVPAGQESSQAAPDLTQPTNTR